MTAQTLYRDLGLAFRFAVLMFAIAAGVVTLIACAKTAQAANLRSTVVLDGDTLTAGDIFSGIDQEKAARILGPAPQPGHDMVLNAVTLMRVANALNIPWRPNSAADQAVIRRAATIVDEGMIRGLVADSLKANGVDGSFRLAFIGNEPKLVLPHSQDARAEVIDIRFDTHNNRFNATLVAPSRDEPLARTQVIGTLERLIEVPVLRDAVRNGDIIGAQHLQWIEVTRRDIQADTVINAEHLLGMTPRRMLMPGKPVRQSELDTPKLVSRGQTITIIYEDGPIALSAKGRALQDGAKGETVRVVNIASNRSIQATVTDEQLVSVQQ